MTQRALAIVALLFAASCWGVSFVVAKRALATVTPEQLMAIRFALAALILLPLALRQSGARRALRPALALGACFFAGYWLQTRGLLYTTAARSSFLTALGVTVVPLLEGAIYRVRVSRLAVFGALLAVVGTAFLFRPEAGALNIGDVLTIICALAFALHTVLASRYAAGNSATWLSLIQIALVGVISAPLAIGPPLEPSRFALIAIVGLAVVNTALAFLLLMWAQARLTATEAAIILAFEPVATAIVAVALGDESASWFLLLGGSLIVSGMVLSQLQPSPRSA